MAEWSSWQAVLLFAFVTAALFFDAKTMKIPNALNAAGVVLGVAVHALVGGGPAALRATVGLAVGFAAAFLLYACKAVGAGDVKCFAALGAMGGWKFAVMTLVYALLFGGCYALLRFAAKGFRRFPERFSSWIWLTAVRRRVLPFDGGPFDRIPFMFAVWPAALWTMGEGTVGP